MIKINNVTRNTIFELLKQGKRMDNRGLLEMRDFKLETDIISTAEGSARVDLGDTSVIVGVKLGLGEPFSDSPEDGVLMTGAELSPMASPEFESGPPGPDSIEVARVVDRVIRETKMIDTTKLCIEPGEKVWMVFVDIYSLDMDGNLFDASALGALAALSTAKVPKLEDGSIVYGEWSGKLPITCRPLSFTYAKLNDSIVFDPTNAEEDVMSCRLTIGLKDKSVCALQKGGRGSFSSDEIMAMAEDSFKQAKILEKKLKF